MTNTPSHTDQNFDSLCSNASHDLRPGDASRIGSREFVVMMALLQALQALAVDSMLPALGRLSHDLGVTDANQRQLVVGLFLIFSGLGSLFPGTLADRFGRRPTLLASLAAYVALTMVCALAPNFPDLLAGRAALGLACAGLTVLPAAIIRDRFEGDKMARLQSMVAMIFMMVPMLAPSIGQIVLLVAGWRWIFGMMGTLGIMMALWVALRLPETLRPEYRQPIRLQTLTATAREVVTCRASFGYVFGMALIQGSLFGYINSTQQLLGEHLGAGRRFPLFFAGMALSIALANFVNSRIVENFGARRVSHAALLAYLPVCIAQVALAFSGYETLWSFVAVMTVTLCLMGFLGANFASIALQPFARIAGAAASVQTFMRMLIASMLGVIIGQAYDGTARPLAISLLLTGIGAIALVLISERGRLFRRLFPAGTLRPVA